MNRRSFISKFVGACVASRIVSPITPVGAPTSVAVAVSVPNAARVAQMAAIQRSLQLQVSSVWSARYREAYNSLSNSV